MNKSVFMGPALESVIVSVRHLMWLRAINMCLRVILYVCKAGFNASARVPLCRSQPLEASSLFKLLNLVFFLLLVNI